MPLVSVIMPVYNCEKFLKESIESILNQTLKDFEFIIVNDGSTDSSSSIILKYSDRDSRIVFIDRKVNMKLPYTLNEGYKYATGKYIARMDADDISFPDRLIKQVNYLDTNHNIYLLGCAYVPFNDFGKKKKVIHPSESIELAYRNISNTFFCHPTVMFKSQLLNLGYKYEDVEAEDFRFFSQIIQNFPCSNLTEPLLYYREHNTSRSFSFRRELLDSVEETTRINISNYFKLKYFRELYVNYRLGRNKSIFQYIMCYILDAIVVFKICTKYGKVSYFFHGFKVLFGVLMSNLKKLSNFISK